MCIFAGLCVFGGVMLIISPYTYNEHGTLCNDGTLGLPLRKVFNHNFVVVARFSLKDDLHLEYSFKNETDSLRSILRRGKQFEWKLRRPRVIDDYDWVQEGFKVQKHIWIYRYAYDASFWNIGNLTFLPYYEKQMEYCVVIIESTSGHCTNKINSSHVVVHLKNGTTSVLSECGKLYYFRKNDV